MEIKSIRKFVQDYIFYIRGFMILVSGFGIIARFIVAIDKPEEFFIEPIKYFTIQTNILVVTWLVLAILHKDFFHGTNEEKMKQLYGRIRGAVTVYITFTWLAYWYLLSGTQNPSGLQKISSNINHYVVPIYFIIDWIVTEQQRYTWEDYLYWLIYPLSYLLFAFLLQVLFGDPVYTILDMAEIGLDGFVIFGFSLFLGFALVGLLYIGVNKLLTRE